MYMPKSRDMHAKIPSPKAILLNFGFVSVKVLNRYDKMKNVCMRAFIHAFFFFQKAEDVYGNSIHSTASILFYGSVRKKVQYSINKYYNFSTV